MVQNNFTLNWTQLGILFSNFTFLIVHFEFEIRRGFQLLFLYYPSFKHILNQGGKKSNNNWPWTSARGAHTFNVTAATYQTVDVSHFVALVMFASAKDGLHTHQIPMTFYFNVNSQGPSVCVLCGTVTNPIRLGFTLFFTSLV